MGMITRHVRRGARVARGLIESKRVFYETRSRGGENLLNRVGVEVTVWPCEGSTRQMWEWNTMESAGEIKAFASRGGEEEKRSGGCLGKAEDPGFKGLMLVECGGDNAGRWAIDAKRNRIELLETGECLTILELAGGGGGGGTRGGAQVVLGTCGEEDLFKKNMTLNDRGEIVVGVGRGDENSEDGEVRKQLDLCFTTGWPFLQAVAFVGTDDDAETPETKTGESQNTNSSITIVVLNEADDAVAVDVKNSFDGKIIRVSTTPHSVNTVVIRHK